MTYQEEIERMWKKPKGKLLINGIEADLKLHSDMAVGYNQALKDVLPVIDRAVTDCKYETIAWAKHLFTNNTPEQVLSILSKYEKIYSPKDNTN
jgi:hypothetical protein